MTLSRWKFKAAAWLLALLGATARGDIAPEDVLIVHNTTVPAGRELAEYYARARGIPAANILGVTLTPGSTLTYSNYLSDVRAPIEKWLATQGRVTWQPLTLRAAGLDQKVEVAARLRLGAVVLMHGMPQKLLHDETRTSPQVEARLKTTVAALESELALLTIRNLLPTAVTQNPVYGQPLGTTAPTNRPLVVVTRLDAPSADIVRARIDEAIAAERRGLAGLACFDLRGLKDGPLAVGDEWLNEAARTSEGMGLPVMVDRQEPLAGGQSLWSPVALYMGWYAHHPGGVLTEPWFRFRPGAIAYHIFSFSALDLHNASGCWTGLLVSRGAAATMGCVEEPYLTLTPNVAIFVNRLLVGDQFGEAAYASQPVLSWMTQVVGDPLYRPFPRNWPAWLARSDNAGDGDAGWRLRIRLNRLGKERGWAVAAMEARRLLATTRDAAGLEGIADVLGNANDARGAMQAYQLAATAATDRVMSWRCQLKGVLAAGDAGERAVAWSRLEEVWRATQGRTEQLAARSIAAQFEFKPSMNPVPDRWRNWLKQPPGDSTNLGPAVRGAVIK